MKDRIMVWSNASTAIVYKAQASCLFQYAVL